MVVCVGGGGSYLFRQSHGLFAIAKLLVVVFTGVLQNRDGCFEKHVDRSAPKLALNEIVRDQRYPYH